MTSVNDTKLRKFAKIIHSLYDGNLLSLNARHLNLLSCFRITGSVEHISSVNTTESGQSTASGRGGGVEIWEYGSSESIMGHTVNQEVNFIVYLTGGPECTHSVFLKLRGFTMSSSFYAQIM